MEPLEILDRHVADAAARLDEGCAKLRTEAAPAEVSNPLSRSRDVSSRATFVDLTELGEKFSSPLAEGTRTWVAALTLERVLWADRVRVAAAGAAESVELEVGGVAERLSPRAAIKKMLADAAPERRAIVGSALAAGVAPVRSAVRLLAERRAEAARQLGASRDALEIPIEGASRDLLHALARRCLTATGDIALELETWTDAFDPLVVRSAGEGWPSHLTPRWIVGLFERSGFLDGVRRKAFEVPPPLGASSFARALAAFGAALADGGRLSSAPFSLAFAPFDLLRARRAALFAGLAATPIFHARALDLGRSRAKDQARLIARGLVLSLRVDAARVLLRDALERPERQASSEVEEVTSLALGAAIPGACAGVIPTLTPVDASRFVGAIVAMNDARELVQRFDEDWFRSPHAARALREADGGRVPQHHVSAPELDAGLAALLELLSDLG